MNSSKILLVLFGHTLRKTYLRMLYWVLNYETLNSECKSNLLYSQRPFKMGFFFLSFFVFFSVFGEHKLYFCEFGLN